MQSYNLDIKISTSAIISKTEPKTLKTPLQEHQKELKTQPFGRSHVDDLAILQSWYQHLQSSALISKTEAKTLKTPLQERLKNSKTQCFWRSHVDDPAIVQSCNPMRYIRQTDGRTEIHTCFTWVQTVNREHNSPSGNNKKRFGQTIIKHLKCFFLW